MKYSKIQSRYIEELIRNDVLLLVLALVSSFAPPALCNSRRLNKKADKARNDLSPPTKPANYNETHTRKEPRAKLV